jgi:hypothetical protein
MCDLMKFVGQKFVYISLFQYLCIVERIENDSTGDIGVFAGTAFAATGD